MPAINTSMILKTMLQHTLQEDCVVTLIPPISAQDLPSKQLEKRIKQVNEAFCPAH